MTDNEIIKAFEHLVKNAGNHIPITGKMLLEDVLGVLNRQKEDNEQYKKVNILIAQQRDERDKNIAELEAEIERLQAMHKEMCIGMKVLKRNAIKEFWDKLKEKKYGGIYPYVLIAEGDNLLKEMEGETK